ncbi:hypothetical protein FO440_17710 [Mucilaginibacter corticis]|uniref:Uncharacterized protein n=1 Tax=Mucilaginibacter corticis TaxID=2597670 RepID=A0A556MI86_9SPHI|nr:hypothetical protein [Mucilaginibacter corticis]TSJ39579.1 hypothetical protein FO440_17710 [Mucilaginibacter corticis]
MSIYHKFYETDFKCGFQTHNAILDITPYQPEVMFLGTNNPNTKENFADFFYGRNYLWPGLKNLFIHNEVLIDNPRMQLRGKPAEVLNPELNEIFTLCNKLRLTFADLILCLFHNNSEYEILGDDTILYQNNEFNLIQDGKKGKIGGLSDLHNLNQVEWNTDNIIKYLQKNDAIKTIYLTRKPDGIWAKHWDKIKIETQISGREFISIYTPSAQGGALHKQTNIYKKGKMIPLINHWIKGPSGRFDSNWLKNNGVDINNF